MRRNSCKPGIKYFTSVNHQFTACKMLVYTCKLPLYCNPPVYTCKLPLYCNLPVYTCKPLLTVICQFTFVNCHFTVICQFTLVNRHFTKDHLLRTATFFLLMVLLPFLFDKSINFHHTMKTTLFILQHTC